MSGSAGLRERAHRLAHRGEQIAGDRDVSNLHQLGLGRVGGGVSQERLGQCQVGSRQTLLAGDLVRQQHDGVRVGVLDRVVDLQLDVVFVVNNFANGFVDRCGSGLGVGLNCATTVVDLGNLQRSVLGE